MDLQTVQSASSHCLQTESSCHIIDIAHQQGPLSGQCLQDPALYEKLEEPTDDENDMLDLAYGLTET